MLLMLKITVVSPSVRPDQIEIVARCLKRQTLKDFEWLIGIPQRRFVEFDREIGHEPIFMSIIEEPSRRTGDYYNLNKCWNSLFRQSKGKLIVSIVDGLWFPPDTLERLWEHYEADPKSCITTIGHQYDRIENGKPEHLVWRDPRARTDLGSFYEVAHTEMELCVASFPRQATVDVGGVDEYFDRFAALSEKEMMARMYKAGYKTYIDQNIEYRALQHPRLSPEWDAKFQEGCIYYNKCMKEIEQGNRLALAFVK